MNISASYNWLKEYLKTDLSPEEFAREFSLRSMSVEAIEKSDDKFANMVVGVIKEIKPHPKADRLRIAVTDVGSRTVEIVCGGANLAVDQRVFVALPGAKVRWHGEGDLIELAETEIRGVKSVGMICAAVEVGFEKVAAGDHDIWDLSQVTSAVAGTPIAEALELNDAIFDIEITTNRPDCMGMIGLAREAGAALGAEFVEPAVTPLEVSSSADLQVNIDAKKLCPRYIAAKLSNVKVTPSPWWLQKKLLQSGHRPINNIVDITNLVLHEFGQPLHTFDASKVSGNQITIRLAKKGEKIVALDGKEYTLTAKHLVIADAEKALAIAGVMGGKDSGTTDDTTSIIFEAATFEPVSIRKTARDLNLYSDSQLVYEKGLSTEALPAALARAVSLAQELAGAMLEGVVDVRAAAYKPQTFPVLFKKIRARIGVDISDDEISTILTRLGFKLEKTGARVVAQVPYWRDHDIEAEVDLTEEVARIYGYHRMPMALPTAPPPTTPDDASLVWEMWLKRFFMGLGYTEFFGYSFTDAKTLELYGLPPVEAVSIYNPLVEDLSHLRPSLIPNILRDIERNQNVTANAAVFELSRVHVPRENDLPDERFRLAVVRYGEDDGEMTYRKLKGVLELLGKQTGVAFDLQVLRDNDKWHPSRSSSISATIDGQQVPVGVLGQVAQVYQDAFDVIKPVFILDLDLERLLPAMHRKLSYVPVSNFPEVRRDISVVVPERTLFSHFAKEIKAVNPLIKSVGYVETYRGTGVEADKKSITLSLTFGADRTLTSEEVEAVMTSVKTMLANNLGGVLRS